MQILITVSIVLVAILFAAGALARYYSPTDAKWDVALNGVFIGMLGVFAANIPLIAGWIVVHLWLKFR